jgi:hypothetical protein
MKNLLEKDFVTHYGLTANVVVNIVFTREKRFDLKDDATLIHPFGKGTAKYENPTQKNINVISYDKFIKSLPPTFQHGREKCDLIVYASDLSFFILNELTETQLKYLSDFTHSDGTPRIGKRNKAISQLKQTLKDLSAVPTIDYFIKQYNIKHCCFFNNPPISPIGIIAPTAFNRLYSQTSYGFKMSNPDIEFYGFEFWEFSTPQTYLLSISI